MSGKSQLQNVVEEQRKQIGAYEKRLKDVIRAYKSLLTEKEALEATVQAFGAAGAGPTTIEPDNQGEGQNEDQNVVQCSDGEGETSSTTASAKEATEREHATNQQQLSALQHALATLTHEKNRQQTAFAADKKRLLDQLFDANKQKEETVNALNSEMALLQQQNAELRAQCSQEQRAADLQTQEHIVQIRELQARLQAEQKAVGSLSSRLSTTNLSEQSNLQQLRTEITGLKHQLNQQKTALQQTETNVKTVEEQYEKKIMNLKSGFETQIERARSRTRLLEQQLHDGANNNAQVYEQRLAEMTQTITDTQRAHANDLQTIERLKQRVNSFEAELCTEGVFSMSMGGVEGETAIIQRLRACITALKEIHQFTALRLYEALGLQSPFDDSAHEQCRANYERLLDDFDRYKTRSSAALKRYEQMERHSPVKSPMVGEPLTKPVQQLQQVQDKVTQLESALAACKRDNQTHIHSLQLQLAEKTKSHEHELSVLKAQHDTTVNELQLQAQKQRERTTELLEDKEREVVTTRAILTAIRSAEQSTDTDGTALTPPDPTVPVPTPAPMQQQYQAPRLSPTLTDTSQGIAAAQNVFFIQQMARKDQELEQLRRQLQGISVSQRDLQHESVTSHLQHHQTIEHLKQEIRCLELKLKLYAENANMEYLKNVLLQLVLCESASGKLPMLRAVAQALKFTPAELSQAQHHYERYYGSTLGIKLAWPSFK